jgi:hypothetical protein
MDLYESDNFIKEKVTFDCSIKNCQINAKYKIRISNEEKSLGEFPYIETEELEADYKNQELNFETLNGIEYRFYQIQLFTIIIMKKNPGNDFYDKYKRQTVMASLVSSKGSKYERNLDENVTNSESFLIEVKAGKSLKNSETMEFFDSSILNYFKEGGKIKLLFFFDFFGKDNNIDLVKSSNIFYNLLVNFYNNCQLYTRGHEIYIFKTKENYIYDRSVISTIKSSREEDFLYFDKFENIKNYFINCLNKDILENQISISPFIENSLNEIEENFFNILIIFVRNLPEDIKIVLDKIEDIKNEDKSINIILINTGNKFSDYLSNTIKEYSNMILIENKDDSQELLLDITHYCLNEIGKNIREFKPKKQNYEDEDNNVHEINNKNIFISENYGGSINSFDENNEEKEEEENKEENEKENKINSESNSNINNNNRNNSSINNSSINNNREGKIFLKTSNTVINCLDNPYSHNKKINNVNNNKKSNLYNSKQNRYFQIKNSIPENINESDSEINKKEENINKEDNKYDESKMVDSKAKTDYTSLNNKVNSKYVLRDDD